MRSIYKYLIFCIQSPLIHTLSQIINHNQTCWILF